MLKIKKTALIVVDVQGKLARLVHNHEILFSNIKKMIRGAKILEIPIIWLEQNPAGLGPTVTEIADELKDYKAITKMTFSCAKNKSFIQELKASGRSQLLIVGIEAHICVYQTAMQLFDLGYQVEIIADAVSSRTNENKELALQKLRDTGIQLSSVEMALFELQEIAEGSRFKEILKIVK